MIAATEGAFDDVAVENVKKAQHALLFQLWSENKKDMQMLDKGDKVDDKLKALILKQAEKVTKEYKEDK